MPKYNTGPISRNDGPPAGQMNFTQDSIEALHRRVLRLRDAGSAIPETVRLWQDSLHYSFQLMVRGLTAHAPWYP